jgi:hypothetical protein
MRPLETSPEELRELVDAASALATEFWAGINRRPAAPRVSGEQSVHRFQSAWDEAGIGLEVLNDFRDIAEWSRPTHGRFFGYVFGSGEPVGAVGDFLASTLNQNAVAWRSAPAAVVIEQVLIGWLADAVGCTGFRGSFCGGGSAANFMGLPWLEKLAPAWERAHNRDRFGASEVHVHP